MRVMVLALLPELAGPGGAAGRITFFKYSGDSPFCGWRDRRLSNADAPAGECTGLQVSIKLAKRNREIPPGRLRLQGAGIARSGRWLSDCARGPALLGNTKYF